MPTNPSHSLQVCPKTLSWAPSSTSTFSHLDIFSVNTISIFTATWMTQLCLSTKPNSVLYQPSQTSKTPPYHYTLQPTQMSFSINIDSSIVYPSPHGLSFNMSVIIDRTFSCDSHINNRALSEYVQLRNISHLCPFLILLTATTSSSLPGMITVTPS